MPDEFDADVAAADLAALTKATGDALQGIVPTSAPGALFRELPSGEIVDRNGQLLRGPIKPLEGKGA